MERTVHTPVSLAKIFIMPCKHMPQMEFQAREDQHSRLAAFHAEESRTQLQLECTIQTPRRQHSTYDDRLQTTAWYESSRPTKRPSTTEYFDRIDVGTRDGIAALVRPATSGLDSSGGGTWRQSAFYVARANPNIPAMYACACPCSMLYEYTIDQNILCVSIYTCTTCPPYIL